MTDPVSSVARELIGPTARSAPSPPGLPFTTGSPTHLMAYLPSTTA